jgi:hypothetical protein
MLRCKIIQFLSTVIPLKVWQDFLLHSHVDRCETCRSKLATREEVKSVLYQESDVEDFREIWPAVEAGINIKKAEKKGFFPIGLKWALPAALLALLIVAGIVFTPILQRNGGSGEQNQGAKFQINSIRVGNEPATPFLYQPQDSDMIIIWAEKSL